MISRQIRIPIIHIFPAFFIPVSPSYKGYEQAQKKIPQTGLPPVCSISLNIKLKLDFLLCLCFKIFNLYRIDLRQVVQTLNAKIPEKFLCGPKQNRSSRSIQTAYLS